MIPRFCFYPWYHDFDRYQAWYHYFVSSVISLSFQARGTKFFECKDIKSKDTFKRREFQTLILSQAQRVFTKFEQSVIFELGAFELWCDSGGNTRTKWSRTGIPSYLVFGGTCFGALLIGVAGLSFLTEYTPERRDTLDCRAFQFWHIMFGLLRKYQLLTKAKCVN